MRAVDLIQRKRDGHELSREEIAFFVEGYTRGAIPDYQASALAMAVFFKGMTPAETVALTRAMMETGEVLDLSDLPGPKVDKHSTGGVGDKTSLILAPLAAACGVFVPMISGRGLGHTGGTLDKLESIPGFRVGLSLDEFRAVLRKSRLGLIGPTPELAAWMLSLAGVTPSMEAARAKVRDALRSGAGLAKLREVIELQGGDPTVCDDPSRLPAAREKVDLRAENGGRVARIACRAVGHAAMLLGAGRETVDSRIDPAVGLMLHKKVGDPVEAGEP